MILIVVTLSWFIAQNIIAEISSVPMTQSVQALNSYADLVQLEWQQKT